MAYRRLNIDGGIGGQWFEATVVEIGLATESDSAGNVVSTLFSKSQIIQTVQETDTAFPVIDNNSIVVEIGLATESDTSGSVSPAISATIVSCASSRGTNIIAAGESALQINVDDSTGITGVTINGVACTAVSIVTPTEVNCNVPFQLAAAPGATVDLIVDNGIPSTALPVVAEPPLGMIYTTFTVDFAGLDPDSPFAGDPNFSAIAIGDVCVFDSISTPTGLSLAMNGLGEFTITGTVTVQQVFDYYIFDASDLTNSATIEQITVQPGPVEVLIGQATESDSAFAVSAIVVITGIIGTAFETDTSFAVIDGSIASGEIGLATEVDSAFLVTGGNNQTVIIGLASETDSSFAVLDGSTPTQTIGLATEIDSSFAIIDFSAVTGLIGLAAEVDTSFVVRSSASLEGIREQLEALLTIITAQQAQIDELYTRFDLNTASPNTYSDDGQDITNAEFRLTKTDNLDATFTITKTPVN
jgi:hypothetical protein